MTKLTRAETAAFLAEHDNYCLLTHRRPDGDTLGSAATLCRGLRQLGKTCVILDNSEATDRFRPLIQGLTVLNVPQGAILVTVDVASRQMLPEDRRELFPEDPQAISGFSLRIDHHSASTSFTQLELVDGDAAACGEVVYDILNLMGASLDKAMAESLYTAISTDTGCFRFANTTAHTFQTAAACAAAGAGLYELNQLLFETNTLGRLKIQAWIVDHMQLLAGGSLALVAIPWSVEQELGVTEDDMDNISNFPRTVAGVRVAATLRENEKGQVKLSVRAIPGFDATRIAAKFGGGGHKGAAGASIDLPLQEAAKAVAKAMLETR